MYIPHVDQFLELKPRTKLEWFDFLHIERPEYAKPNLMKAYNSHFYQIRGLQACREARGVVTPLGEPPAGVLADVMARLDSGEFFLINKRTIYPAVERLEIKQDNTIEWELSSWLRDNIKLYLDHALYNCRVPHMHTPIRGEDLSQLTPATKPAEKKKTQIEKHMIQLELESENNAPLPDRKNAIIFVHNTSQDTTPVEQRRDVIYNPESRIFKAKTGDSFNVYVIDEKMKTVMEDLKKNGNVKQSETDGLIKPLEITGTDTTPDNVTIHYVKYVVPEEKNLIIHYEFGLHEKKPSSDLLWLKHEDSDWSQQVFVAKQASQVGTDEDGWLEITFRDIPKEGKFSLYRIVDHEHSSPIAMFTDKAFEEITNDSEEEALESGYAIQTPHPELDTKVNEFEDWLRNLAN